MWIASGIAWGVALRDCIEATHRGIAPGMVLATALCQNHRRRRTLYETKHWHLDIGSGPRAGRLRAATHAAHPAPGTAGGQRPGSQACRCGTGPRSCTNSCSSTGSGPSSRSRSSSQTRRAATGLAAGPLSGTGQFPAGTAGRAHDRHAAVGHSARQIQTAARLQD